MNSPTIGVILTVFKEPFEMVDKQVGVIKTIYPHSDVILCYDGTDQYQIDNVTSIKFADRLKTRSTAGLWTDSWMKSFLNNSEADYMLKLDPDTVILKKIEMWPEGEVVFGTIKETKLAGGNIMFRIHGGGCGYSRSMVKKIVDNRWMLSSYYVNNIQFQDQEDVMIAHMIKQNNLNYFNHPEFSCGRPINDQTSIQHR